MYSFRELLVKLVPLATQDNLGPVENKDLEVRGDLRAPLVVLEHLDLLAPLEALVQEEMMEPPAKTGHLGVMEALERL